MFSVIVLHADEDVINKELINNLEEYRGNDQRSELSGYKLPGGSLSFCSKRLRQVGW